MVRKFIVSLLLSVFLFSNALSNVYQINIVKERKQKKSKNSFILYVVKKGDYLSEILEKFSIPLKFLYRIVEMNGIRNPNFIYPGQKLKIPSFSLTGHKARKINSDTYEKLDLLRKLGAKIDDKGYIFLGDRKISLRKNPKIIVGNREYLVDFGNLSVKDIKFLTSVGINVLEPKQLGKIIDKFIESNFSQVLKNGKFILGASDILIYKYDYLVYDTVSGRRIVINKEPDTPPALRGLLNSYGIYVVEPKFVNPNPSEGLGKLVILKGEGISKISNLLFLLTGKKFKRIEDGVIFPDLKIAVVYDSITPEESVKLKLEGNRVSVLTGNFLYDVKNILSLVPVANKEVVLVLNEPPETNGKRAQFKKRGLLITTQKRTWFMVDDVEKPEEIPYLRYRGVNLIFY
ncbi:LysM domain-containing protein [Balnearium lithotrophicum]|uniref:LysM domain-containing protein n=1 Tax=Balnearium lithotrophicum TaxID=223788 RepID=A0A521D8E7_9BACT|nr:LysM peptidoglycan-binding domain-containing protein [Balnearium lithotrophicum]SMO67875.1 LysM domain-containing protein [Balnearium lithotrophicum]